MHGVLPIPGINQRVRCSHMCDSHGIRSTTLQLGPQLLAIEGIISINKGKGASWLDLKRKKKTGLGD